MPTITTNGKLSVDLGDFLEISRDATVHMGRNLEVLGYNSSAARALELHAPDIGKPFGEPSLMAHHKELLAAAQEVLDGQQRVNIETLEISGRLYEGHAVALKSSEEECAGAMVLLKDVTESRQLQQKLEFAVEAAFMNWWEWNIVRDHFEYHSIDDNLLGMDPENLPTDRQAWMDWVHPEDLEYVTENLEACLVGDSDLWFCECRMKTADGGWIWVDHRGKVTRRNPEGHPIEMMGTSQDIDATKRAHLDMRSKNDMLEQAGEIVKLGTWEYYPETETITWSKQTRRILGVDDGFEANAEAFYECLEPADAQLIRTAFEKTMEEGTGYNLRLRCTNRQGKKMVVRSACKARFDLFGKLTRVSGIFQDITDEPGVEGWDD